MAAMSASRICLKQIYLGINWLLASRIHKIKFRLLFIQETTKLSVNACLHHALKQIKTLDSVHDLIEFYFKFFILHLGQNVKAVIFDKTTLYFRTNKL